MARPRGITLLGTLGAAVWLFGAVLGTSALAVYSSRAGESGRVDAHWPEGSSLPALDERARLVMFAHPRCPCTLASVRELQRLAAKLPEDVEILVVVNVPAGAHDEAWTDTALVREIADIPRAQTILDPGGVETERFGVETSGHVVVYDAAGHQRFEGGITSARGHEGDSAGALAILEIASGGDAHGSAAVFGCSQREKAP